MMDDIQRPLSHAWDKMFLVCTVNVRMCVHLFCQQLVILCEIFKQQKYQII